MLRYIARRLLWGVALLFVVCALIFGLFSILPTGDPATLRAGRQASPQDIETIRETLGLDQSTPEQFLDYLTGVGTAPESGLLLGKLGYSFENDAPVLELILDALPATVFLVLGALVVWLLVGIPTGIISAIRRRSMLDRVTMITTLALISAPVFWLGLVALYLFSKEVGLVPIFPGSGSYQTASGPFEHAAALFLPWLVLAAAFAAIYARYVRSSLIDVMSEDYIRTARAKGLSERRVILRHGLRSAITPVVTLLGLDVGVLIAGNAILTETVFNIPGVGRLVYDSILRADLPMIQGLVLFGAFFIIVFNLVVDIAYAYLDPRVRYE